MVLQQPLPSKHEAIGQPTIAHAICDPIGHGAHLINLEGDSVRKQYAERANRDPAERLGYRPDRRRDRGGMERYCRTPALQSSRDELAAAAAA